MRKSPTDTALFLFVKDLSGSGIDHVRAPTGETRHDLVARILAGEIAGRETFNVYAGSRAAIAIARHWR